MKGKKIITVLLVVCLLSILLSLSAFATVTDSSGDGFALYNGVKLPDIDTVWTDKESYPYAAMTATGSVGILLIGSQPFIPNAVGGYVTQGDAEGYLYDPNGLMAGTAFLNWGYVGPVSSSTDAATWTSHDIFNEDGSVYLAASTPISLDGYNLIEWDGDTTGLEVVGEADNLYIITSLDEMVVDAFTVMHLSYSDIPVVLNEFYQVDGSAWYVVGPTSSYYISAAGELYDGFYDVAVLKFDDIDDTGYTSLIAYRSVESPPDEGGGDDDDPQPPCGG